ncbi:transcriptional regulator family: Fungal Specific TF [Penicillium hispanicum]|uniref:transcriptional regulator family: Fungal Specific TF n=1 Tax=Penicillium hispanicum TaxID=1080232 RepID=UPI00253FF157|nr:transcriptional regulator family: Fungal Specific TF [Penicillium hispanicum]KAJ5573733.1 transcriptional regulator family: Fungal Specific TF [Penicillium hispanicum]
MDPECSDLDGHEGPGSLARRAIRCDKRTPCSNCRSSNIACRSTGKGQRPSEPRRRVLISSQYEKKIDKIEERLGAIEKALREIVISSRLHGHRSTRCLALSQETPLSHPWTRSSAPKPTSQLESVGKDPSYTANPAIEQYDAGSEFETNSSLTAHSVYAKEYLECAVSHSTPEISSSPKISEALSSLRQIVEMQRKRREPDAQRNQFASQSSRAGVRYDIRDLEMPPLPTVLTVLRKVKENPPSSFGGYIPFFSVDYFIGKCREVYFCTDEYSDATFIVTNVGLYNVFIELGYAQKETPLRDEYQQYVQMCKDNLEACLANLSILMPASMESIVALALGAMHGIEISKPSVGWTLASSAIHMCQTLGYHRLSSMEYDPPDVQQQKQTLFWSVYTILNVMSLRLGRASVIQDYDISIPSPSDTFSRFGTWGSICALWTKQAMIQNKMYMLLYSPAALNQPESERVSHARRLAAEMHSSIIGPFEHIMSSNMSLNDVDIIYLRSDKVNRLAILTLIYRAIPAPESSSSSPFIPECIESARGALEIHQECVGALKETNEILRTSYTHWAIFLSPFVPFIVIFCHVIETSDTRDLVRLQDFIASLRPLCAFSQSVDRLHNLCSVLGTVARLYVEAKSRSKAGEDQSFASVGQEFDVYLSALGLAPGNVLANNLGWFQPDNAAIPNGPPDSSTQASGLSFQGPQSQNPEVASEAEMSQAAQLGNWFSGNQYMMGLLEEDLFQFNPSA